MSGGSDSGGRSVAELGGWALDDGTRQRRTEGGVGEMKRDWSGSGRGSAVHETIRLCSTKVRGGGFVGWPVFESVVIVLSSR